MKKILPVLLFLSTVCLSINAQDGTLSNLVFDTIVEQGQTNLTFTFDYTASEAGTVEWQLITALPDGTPNWGQPNVVYMVVNVDAAADATTASFTYDVGNGPVGTYTWAGKVTLAGMDLGYNNAGNLVDVTEGGGGPITAGGLSNLSYDAEVVPGTTDLTFSFDYTATEDGTVEWQLLPAMADGSPDWSGTNAAYASYDITEAATPTNNSFTYEIPMGAALGTYTWAGKVTLAGMDLGYNNTGNLVEITDAVNTTDLEFSTKYFTLSPNPVTDILTIIAKEENSLYMIYNQLGQVVKTSQAAGLTHQLDLSSLPTGTYWVKSDTGLTKAVNKL